MRCGSARPKISECADSMRARSVVPERGAPIRKMSRSCMSKGHHPDSRAGCPTREAGDCRHGGRYGTSVIVPVRVAALGAGRFALALITTLIVAGMQNTE